MPRKKLANPSYRLHVSGQARVTLDGTEYYLGTHESPGTAWACGVSISDGPATEPRMQNFFCSKTITLVFSRIAISKTPLFTAS